MLQPVNYYSLPSLKNYSELVKESLELTKRFPIIVSCPCHTASKENVSLKKVHYVSVDMYFVDYGTNPFQPSFQKHPKEVFCKICVLKNFIKLTGKGLCWSFFLNKVAGLKPASLFKKGLQHRCFSVNLVKLLRTLFTEHLPVTVEHLPVLHSI